MTKEEVSLGTHQVKQLQSLRLCCDLQAFHPRLQWTLAQVTLHHETGAKSYGLVSHFWSICNIGYMRPSASSPSRNKRKIKP